jgi:hypothetical protein
MPRPRVDRKRIAPSEIEDAVINFHEDLITELIDNLSNEPTERRTNLVAILENALSQAFKFRNPKLYKLSIEQIQEIHTRLNAKPRPFQKDLALEYGVSNSTIALIKKKRRWW